MNAAALAVFLGQNEFNLWKMSFGLLKMQFQPMVIAKIFLGRGNPLPKPHPLDAFGVSLVPPLAAHFCPQPKNPGNATAEQHYSILKRICQTLSVNLYDVNFITNV